RVIDTTLARHAEVGAPPTWVLSNHDVPRHVTRYGRQDSSFGFGARLFRAPVDLDLGTRRARAAALLCLALPGGAYVYQGEELGLWGGEHPPSDRRRDRPWERGGHVDGTRDGCRVPLPWSGDEPPFGFGPPGGAAPWLPQPPEWKGYTAAIQAGDPRSM